MPESYGSGFPTSGIQEGWRHVSSTTGLIYRYIGGDPSDNNNWIVDGGRTGTDPDTASWGVNQAGAYWYNTTKKINQYWTGTHLRTSTIQTVTIVANEASIDAGDGDHFRIILDQDINTFTLSGDRDGQRVLVEVIQDGTGSRALTWPSNVRFSTDLIEASFIPSVTAGSTTYFGLVFNNSVGKFDAIAITKGF